jgi:hypothetical protein
VTGAVDSKNNLTLTSSALPNGNTIKVLLGITGVQEPYAGAGTIEVDGSTCTFAQTAATGVEVTNASGTFTGTLSPGTLLSPAAGTSATVSLIVTQSASPGADRQFATTGTLNYGIGSCPGSVLLSGTVSGVGMILTSINGAPANPQTVSFLGTINPAATTMTVDAVDFMPAPCSTDPASSATYFGTLNRQ